MRRFVACLVVVAVVGILPFAVASPASGQDDEQPTTTQPTGSGGINSIIGPLPGQGQAPEDAGDRGGALQLTLAAVLFVAIGLVGTLALRDVRRARDRSRTASPRDDRPGRIQMPARQTTESNPAEDR